MATLALAAAGSAIGSALLPSGVPVLGATLSGAAIGQAVGAIAGSIIDGALFGASGQSQPREGPRLSGLHVISSTEGTAIPRLYSRARLGGQIIWATDIEEKIVKQKASSTSGTKGGGGGGGSGDTITEYLYYANFAVAICEGPVSGVSRIWADGHELSLSKYTWRLYTGTETQAPDGLIAAKLGAVNTPAFRGVAYIVFERMPLKDFGNRIPQLSFEVSRQIDSFGAALKGVTLIPGSGEFVYAQEPVIRHVAGNVQRNENVNTKEGGTNWKVALDQMKQALPNVQSVSLIVSWFGTDLRAGSCQVLPGVDSPDKVTSPISWGVAGVDRSSAYQVSAPGGIVSYGGTPSDQTVVDAIQDLKARGYSVVLTPFILMDIPPGNDKPDPYRAGTPPGQPTFPWRGRITVSPAPGVAGTVDQTAAAASQIASFVGTAQVSDFSVSGETVSYSGPSEWSFRRMILHYAHIAKAAGGVDGFQIGSELRGLTWVRSGAAGPFPFVDALVQLAADVKSVLAPFGTKILYGADWSEFTPYQTNQFGGPGGEVFFHLDSLWSSPDIDAIGIDNYWPLADWRDGREHLDFQAGHTSIYDLAYLRGNVAGGEGYDWFYASQADRDAQVRTPITDGYGKPWVFRYKDIRSWWENQHFNRPGGVESGTPTSWVPQSKPIWFMETGCPAVDKGANQPNVFVDPKSSESFFPYYSRRTRDDLMQQSYIEAMLSWWDPDLSGYAGGNPVSGVYGGRMADPGRIHVYTWDARPYPAFPTKTSIWSDGENWRFGHWLSGRTSGATLHRLVSRIMSENGFADFEASGLHGIVSGYVIDRVLSVRDAVQPLELAFFFDSFESGGKILFRHRGADPAVAALTPDDLAVEEAAAVPLSLTRGQETELPASAKITYISGAGEYKQAVAEARRLTGWSGRVSTASLPFVLEDEIAGLIAGQWLFEAWSARERASFTLPPSRLAVEPSDVLAIQVSGETRLFRVTELSERGARAVTALSIDPEVYGGSPAAPRAPDPPGEDVVASPTVYFLDLPLITGQEPPAEGYAAAFQDPWPGGIAVWSSPATSGFVLRGVASAPAIAGATLDPLPGGPEGRLDRATKVRVTVGGGELFSADLVQVLAGANTAAVRNADGQWEVLQFETASLAGEKTYELSGLLRGQYGTEGAMRSPVAAGAPFVVLDSALLPLGISPAELHAPLNWRSGPADKDVGAPEYVAAVHTFQGQGLRPLSPVHVRGVRDGSGNLTISWIRRTRTGGDNWEQTEVPLAEDSEAYEVDVLNGANVVRTLAAASPSVTYTAAQQTADFGAPQPSVSVKVFQISASQGRGSPRAAVV